MQRISNKEIIREIRNRQQLNSRALIRHTQGIVIRIAKRSLDRNLKRERSRKKNPLHKWRGPWINNTGKNKYMDHKRMDWFLREIVLQHLDFRLDTREGGGGRGRGEGGNGGGGHSYFLSRPAASHVGPWNPLEHRHWNLVPFGTQLPPFLHGAPAQGSGVLCEGGAAPKCKIQAKYI